MRDFRTDRLETFEVGPGSTFTGTGIVRTPQRIGFPIHQYALHDGTCRRSWGGERHIDESSASQLEVAQIAPTRGGELWVLGKRPTRVELHAGNGKFCAALPMRLLGFLRQAPRTKCCQSYRLEGSWAQVCLGLLSQ